MTELREVIEEVDAEAAGGRPGYVRFAAEFGLRWFEMRRDWARWVLSEPEKH